jgi:hypothetical protein
MKSNRPLIAAVYVLAALMLVLPLLEVTLSVWPLRFGQTSWRFGTLGLVSQALVTPLLGGLLLILAGLQLGHRRTVRVLAVTALLATVLLVMAVPLFVLDAVQMRGEVRPEAQRAFDLSSMLATIKLLATLVVTGLTGVGGWRITRQKVQAPRVTEQLPLVTRMHGS